MLLRRFQPEDAEAVSRLIVEVLRSVNVHEYSVEAVEAMIPSFTPDKLTDQAGHQYTIVCLQGGDLVGTAALDGDRVRNVFVAVQRQRRGIGRALMADLEAQARANQRSRVYLHASLSAESFYRRLGYQTRRRVEREVEGFPVPVIHMEKELSTA